MHRQYMHLGRMDELRRATWLQHTIPHLTARKLELTTDAGGWGTF
jgi:E3 ubiquitin-protein ligase UBR1